MARTLETSAKKFGDDSRESLRNTNTQIRYDMNQEFEAIRRTIGEQLVAEKRVVEDEIAVKVRDAIAKGSRPL